MRAHWEKRKIFIQGLLVPISCTFLGLKVITLKPLKSCQNINCSFIMSNYHSESNKWHLNIVWRWAKFTFPTPRNFPLCMTSSFSTMILRLTSSECHTCFTIAIVVKETSSWTKIFFYRSRGRGSRSREIKDYTKLESILPTFDALLSSHFSASEFWTSLC